MGGLWLVYRERALSSISFSVEISSQKYMYTMLVYETCYYLDNPMHRNGMLRWTYFVNYMPIDLLCNREGMHAHCYYYYSLCA